MIGAEHSIDDSIHVLHVDDDEAFLQLAKSALLSIDPDFEIQQTTDPTAVPSQIPEERIECIISDYRMPQCTGVELLKQIRSTYPDLPFILCTGHGSEEVASKAISAGVTDYVSKGTGLEAFELLANRIRGAVEQRRVKQSLAVTREGYEKLLETAPDAILIVDADTGTILRVNKAAEELFGRPREELQGLNQTELHPPEERKDYRQTFEEHAGSRGIIHDDRKFTIVHADGHTIPVEINSAPLELGDRLLVQGIFRDLRDRHE